LHLAGLLQASDGPGAAIDFISAQLGLKPSLRLLNALLELRILEAEQQEPLQLMKSAIEKVLAESPAYQCHRCGFSGKKLHWLCPSCKSWGSIRPIKGVTGE